MAGVGFPDVQNGEYNVQHREGFYVAALAVVIRNCSYNGCSVRDIADKVFEALKDQLSKEDQDHYPSEPNTPIWLRMLRNLMSHRVLEALGLTTYDHARKVWVATPELKSMSHVQIHSYVKSHYNKDWRMITSVDDNRKVIVRAKDTQTAAEKAVKKAAAAAAAVNSGVSPEAKAEAEAHSAQAEKEAARAKAEAEEAKVVANAASEKAREKAREAAEEAEAEEAAPPEGNRNSKKTTVNSSGYARDPKVAAFTKDRANGGCQCCGGLVSKERGLGLIRSIISHHVIFRSDDGADMVDNTIGLCPNCHDEAHLGGDESANFREELYIMHGQQDNPGNPNAFLNREAFNTKK